MTVRLFPPLNDYVRQLLREADRIPDTRKQTLLRLSEYLRSAAAGPRQLNFICTHNSRRSHLAQIWAAVAAHHYDLDHVATFSGGTEATAFNPRVVAALSRAGFEVTDPGGPNPRYRVGYATDRPPLICWSKTYDDPTNPKRDFAAVMTCADADEHCPYIPGTDLRLALTYNDPKAADGTPEEAARYDERTRQIGREMLFTFDRVGE